MSNRAKKRKRLQSRLYKEYEKATRESRRQKSSAILTKRGFVHV